jgi:phospholipid transport system substrate-binding protein
MRPVENAASVAAFVSSSPVSAHEVPDYRPRTASALKAAAFAAGFGLAAMSNPAAAAPASGGHAVQGLYDALLDTMKRGGTLDQQMRFARLEPVIHRSFDIPSMTRLSVGSSWATLTQTQRQQVIESFERYISAIYADRFSNYAGQKFLVIGERPAAAGSYTARSSRPMESRSPSTT